MNSDMLAIYVEKIATLTFVFEVRCQKQNCLSTRDKSLVWILNQKNHGITSYEIWISQRLLLCIPKNGNNLNYLFNFIWPFQNKKILEDDTLQRKLEK